jgi:hypothetical protein
MSLMKPVNIRQFCIDHWRVLSLYGALLLVLLITVTLKLHTLLPGFSSGEVQTYQASESLRTILHHPVNAPYLVLSWLIIKLHTSQPLLYLRMVSAWLGLCTLTIFCGLLYYWHGHRVALIGTLLFGTSGWFLHIARLGTPAVLMFGLFVLVACGLWLQTTQNPYAMAALIILGAGLMYVPGMVWLIALYTVFNWKWLYKSFTKQLRVVTVGAIIAAGMVVPFGLAIVQTPSIGKIVLNLPARGWPSFATILRQIAQVPYHIFLYGQSSPVFGLGHLPVLSVFGVVMFGFGMYQYARRASRYHLRLIGTLLIAGAIVIGLGGMTNVGLLVPFLYLVVSSGVGYLFDQWYSVFPKNPLAQAIGLLCVCLLVLLVVTYNTRAYFISWPNATSTKATFALTDIGSRETFDTIHR